MPDEKPEIFIDEGWKARVQREKEEARKTADQAEKPAAEGPGPAQPEGEAEASFLGLVNSLAAQTMFALGVIAPQGAKEVVVDIGQAKYLVDTLMVLREKTKGNLSPEEQGALGQAIAELQRVYVVRAQQAQESVLRNAGPAPKKK